MNIIWTEDAKQSYYETIDFILARWTEKEVIRFADEVGHVLDLITVSPFMFRHSDKMDIRIAIIQKKTSLFYLVNKTEIVLLLFWDNRRNPATLKILH